MILKVAFFQVPTYIQLVVEGEGLLLKISYLAAVIW